VVHVEPFVLPVGANTEVGEKPTAAAAGVGVVANTAGSGVRRMVHHPVLQWGTAG
jgi:hypothetical protein